MYHLTEYPHRRNQINFLTLVGDKLCFISDKEQVVKVIEFNNLKTQHIVARLPFSGKAINLSATEYQGQQQLVLLTEYSAPKPGMQYVSLYRCNILKLYWHEKDVTVSGTRIGELRSPIKDPIFLVSSSGSMLIFIATLTADENIEIIIRALDKPSFPILRKLMFPIIVDNDNLKSVALALSQDEKTLAVGYGSTLVLWNLQDGRPKKLIDLCSEIKDHRSVNSEIKKLAFSPDGEKLAIFAIKRIYLYAQDRVLAYKDCLLDDSVVVTMFTFSPDSSILLLLGRTQFNSFNCYIFKGKSLEDCSGSYTVYPYYLNHVFRVCLQNATCFNIDLKTQTLISGRFGYITETDVFNTNPRMQLSPDGYKQRYIFDSDYSGEPSLLSRIALDPEQPADFLGTEQSARIEDYLRSHDLLSYISCGLVSLRHNLVVIGRSRATNPTISSHSIHSYLVGRMQLVCIEGCEKSCALSLDGQLLAVCMVEGNYIFILDGGANFSLSGRIITLPDKHKKRVNKLAFLKDNTLAFGTSTGYIGRINLVNKKIIEERKVFSNGSVDFLIAGDDVNLISAESKTGIIHIWKQHKRYWFKKPILSLNMKMRISNLALLRNSLEECLMIALANNTIELINILEQKLWKIETRIIEAHDKIINIGFSKHVPSPLIPGVYKIVICTEHFSKIFLTIENSPPSPTKVLLNPA